MEFAKYGYYLCFTIEQLSFFNPSFNMGFEFEKKIYVTRRSGQTQIFGKFVQTEQNIMQMVHFERSSLGVRYLQWIEILQVVNDSQLP